jgi:hypothetical protein
VPDPNDTLLVFRVPESILRFVPKFTSHSPKNKRRIKPQHATYDDIFHITMSTDKVGVRATVGWCGWGGVSYVEDDLEVLTAPLHRKVFGQIGVRIPSDEVANAIASTKVALVIQINITTGYASFIVGTKTDQQTVGGVLLRQGGRGGTETYFPPPVAVTLTPDPDNGRGFYFSTGALETLLEIAGGAGANMGVVVQLPSGKSGNRDKRAPMLVVGVGTDPRSTGRGIRAVVPVGTEKFVQEIEASIAVDPWRDRVPSSNPV